MIIWGSRGKSIDLGETGEKQCPTCEKVRKYRHVLQYRYGHLYYIFGFVTHEQHAEVCEVCSRGSVIPKAEAKAKLQKNPIPFIHRLGWTLFIGLIALIIVAANLAPATT